VQLLELFDAARSELVVRRHRLFQQLLQQHDLPAELPFSDSSCFPSSFSSSFSSSFPSCFTDFDALLLRVEESGFFITLDF
jgi:hypothetical protein